VTRWHWVAAAALTLLGLAGCDRFASPETRIKKGEAAVAAADYRAAMVQFKNALQDAPDNVDARLGLAASALALGDPLSAEKEIARAEALRAPPARFESLKWRTALALGHSDEVQKALAEHRDGLSDGERLSLRAEALGRLRRLDESLALYRQALALPSATADAQIGFASVLVAAGRPDEALAQIAAVLARDPSSAAALVARAATLKRLGQVDAAADSFAEARKHANPRRDLPVFVAAVAGVVDINLTLGHLDVARGALADLTANAPNAVTTQILRARFALAEHRLDDAIEGLDRVLRAQPENVQALSMQGMAQAERGHLAQSETILAKAVRLQPENATLRKLLAEVQVRQGRGDAAVATLAARDETALDADSALLLARAAIANGDRGGAIERLRQALTLDPGNAAAKLELASLYVAEGQSARALALLDELPDGPRGEYRAEAIRIYALAPEKRAAEIQRLVTSRAADPGAHNFAGLYYLSQRQFDPARGEFEAVLKLAPADPAALANLARLEFQAGRLDATESALQKLLAIPRSATDARIALAALATRRGDAPQATHWLEEARAKDTRAIEPRVLLARSALDAGQFDLARTVVREAVALDPRRIDVLTTAALVEERAGDPRKALEFLNNATTATPDSADAWFVKSRYQSALGDGKAAQASLQKSLQLRPGWAAAAADLAELKTKAGDVNGAMVVARDLKAKNATHVEGLVLEADVEAARGNFAAAADGYSRALALRPAPAILLRRYRVQVRGHLPGGMEGLKSWLAAHPADGAVRVAYAQALQANNDPGGAAKEYERVLEIAPDNPVVLNNLAWLYNTTHDPRALPTARNAYRLSPKTPSIVDTLAWVLAGQGQYSEAVGLLESIVSNPVADGDIGFHYAYVLARVGRKAEAKQAIASILARPDRFDSRSAAETLGKELN
jgi:putative PEP-CTERM system TPR-repeat lipoprotein